MKEETSKESLKEARKERKQAKKVEKKLLIQKEKNEKLLNLKLGPTDQKISIISRQTVTNIKKPLQSPQSSSVSFNLNDFPLLGTYNNISKIFPRESNNTVIENEQNTPGPSTSKLKPCIKSSISINLSDLITKPSTSKSIRIKEKPSDHKPYSGNILDSSLPERHKGKKREVPKKKSLTKLKSEIIAESQTETVVKTEYDGIHSPLFETYCENVITENLNRTAKQFLSDIVRFQENVFKKDPFKAATKRRYVVGMREVKRYIIVDRIKVVIIAPNIKITLENGALNKEVSELINLAKAKKIPYIFALNKWKLGDITLKFRPISCVGVFDFSGAEGLYHELINMLETARNTYKNLIRCRMVAADTKDKTKSSKSEDNSK